MRYCGQCAAPLVPPCPHCRFQNSPQSRFCGQCAAPLPISPEVNPPREMKWATGTFVVLSIVVLLGAGALYSAALDGRFSTKLGDAALLIASVAPAMIALLLAAAEGGPDGIKRLLSPALIWRVDLRWYLIATAIPILGGLSAVELASIQGYVFGESAPPLRPLWALWYLYAGLRIAPFSFWIMFVEMTGWIGYALPRLQRTHGALTSSLILGAGFVIMTQAPGLLGFPSPFIQRHGGLVDLGLQQYKWQPIVGDVAGNNTEHKHFVAFFSSR
jgi:hypothetical protein